MSSFCMTFSILYSHHLSTADILYFYTDSSAALRPLFYVAPYIPFVQFCCRRWLDCQVVLLSPYTVSTYCHRLLYRSWLWWHLSAEIDLEQLAGILGSPFSGHNFLTSSIFSQCPLFFRCSWGINRGALCSAIYHDVSWFPLVDNFSLYPLLSVHALGKTTIKISSLLLWI